MFSTAAVKALAHAANVRANARAAARVAAACAPTADGTVVACVSTAPRPVAARAIARAAALAAARVPTPSRAVATSAPVARISAAIAPVAHAPTAAPAVAARAPTVAPAVAATAPVARVSAAALDPAPLIAPAPPAVADFGDDMDMGMSMGMGMGARKRARADNDDDDELDLPPELRPVRRFAAPRHKRIRVADLLNIGIEPEPKLVPKAGDRQAHLAPALRRTVPDTLGSSSADERGRIAADIKRLVLDAADPLAPLASGLPSGSGAAPDMQSQSHSAVRTSESAKPCSGDPALHNPMDINQLANEDL
ncbi:hypothetical protein HK105_208148 [Polyrhizophydium stewartii]|uniref:Uncharacterized protein n=1 Tax=Polyrhizophydium stewartii TaxID=2732419 RepID=A0ABR4MYR8_9FUNG